MTEAQFDAVKAGLLIEVRHKDRNLAERSARYWRESTGRNSVLTAGTNLMLRYRR